MIAPHREAHWVRERWEKIVRVLVLALAMSSLRLQDGMALERQQYDQALQRFQQLFHPLAQSEGRTLLVDTAWLFPTIVWSYALRSQEHSIIGIYGGLAQHHLLNEGVLILALCHELGHFYAGPPFMEHRFVFDDLSTHYSTEGQADYFATAFCMKTYYQHFPPLGEVTTEVIGAAITLEAIYAQAEQAEAAAPPPPERQEYPPLPCRLKTWVAGALCSRPVQEVNTAGVANSYCYAPERGLAPPAGLPLSALPC